MKSYIEEETINLRDHACIRARCPLLVAHRGGVIAPNAPENSLASIRLAGTRDYDMVELDIKEAKDKEPILFHDFLGSNLLFGEIRQSVRPTSPRYGLGSEVLPRVGRLPPRLLATTKDRVAPRLPSVPCVHDRPC